MKMKVKVPTMVKPRTEKARNTLRISNLDARFPLKFHAFTHYLYRSTGTADFFDPAVLKAALSRALVEFYPLAGRLKKDKDRTENGHGELFVEAESDATLDDLGDFRPRFEITLIPKVDYSQGISTFPLLLVQLTRFKCGGVCLGIAIHHRLVDGISAIHFINTWSDIARGLEIEARGLPDDQESKLNIMVDGRSRLQPPLPPGYLGNVVFDATHTALCGELESNPLKFVVSRVHEAIARMDDDYLRSAIDYLELRGDVETGPHKSPNLVITSWARLPCYEADFGWGRPVFMGLGSVPLEGYAFLMPNPGNDGSLSLALSIPKEQLQVFEKL